MHGDVPLAEADRVIGNGHMHTVLFDEVQYTDPDRISRLLEMLDEKGVRGIFAFDPVWASYDSCSTAAIGLLKQREDIEQYRLTAKIRTNRETAVFTECLFDLTRRKVPPHPHNIRLAYTEDRQETGTLIRLCREDGYRNISREETLMRGYLEEETDKAVVILDDSYSYGEDGRLVSADPEALRRLQRRVSRVRQSLYVVTENNPAVFRALVSLFR